MASRRVQYSFKEKRRIIVAAEKDGNRQAARDNNVSECNIRLWRKQRDAIFRCSAKRMSFRGKKAQYPEIEEILVEYIKRQRSKYLPVSRRMLCRAAREEAAAKGIQNFKASESWLNNFLRRSGFSLRRRTSICQKLPAAFEEKLVAFQRYIIKLRRQHEYLLQHIGNADETPIYFDMPRSTTIDETGKKEVRIISTGYEKFRITVMLCILGDGQKLPPYMILKRKTIPKKERFPIDVVVRCNTKGWMTSELMQDWVNAVWKRRPGGIRSLRSLLALDAFKGHVTSEVKDELRHHSVDLVVIPGGMTNQLQPLDVSINKPFKAYVKDEYEDWLHTDNLPRTASGKIRKAPASTVARWVSNAWKRINPEMIRNSFKKCCITNNLDESEDDLMWNHGNDSKADTSGDEDNDHDIDDPSSASEDDEE